jgi:hypothetical protein
MEELLGIWIELVNLLVNVARLVAELMKEKSPKPKTGKGTHKHLRH